ncbi:MAG: ARPP-1 family domain-containing protein, partial [Terriglobia bacterium]
MSRRLLLLLFALALATAGSATSRVAPPPALQGWQVHEPIVSSNLVIFPVTSASRHDTSGYLTLDEGLRTGEVEVTELGAALIRRRPGTAPRDRAQVNKLVLINHSAKPLILLAGEIVTGGKQDRVIAKDRIIPPAAAPLPLDVFCVEPGRWHGASLTFSGKSVMAAPKVRERAAVAKNQQEVWDATEETRRGVVAGLAAEAPAARRALADSSSYALLESNRVFKGRIDTASGELQRELEQ